MPGHRLVDYESHWSLEIFLILGEEAFLPLKIGKYNTKPRCFYISFVFIHGWS